MSHLLTGQLTFKSLKQLDTSKCTKQDILDYFLNSYNLYESLFTSISDDTALYLYPDRLRLPLIFYYGHTAAVYVNKLMLAQLLKKRINVEYETIFETGVDEMFWDDTVNQRIDGKPIEWPEVSDVVTYRRQVKNAILQMINDTPLELPITMESKWWGLLMGMAHERIHLETSSVLIRQIPVNLVTKPLDWVYAEMKTGNAVGPNSLISVKGQEVKLGKPRNFPSYGWDNEYGEASFRIPDFEATKYLVTNEEFLQFVMDKGYKRQELWSEEGWQWRSFRGANHPTFWVCGKGCKSGCGESLSNYTHCQLNDTEDQNQPTYFYRAMFDVITLPRDWPVEVNFHEAKAYCTWRGPNYRLPTEAEGILMKGSMPPISEGVNCDIIHSGKPDANINFKYGSPTPVNMFPPTDAGFYDMFGNVWMWLEDDFNGFQGFHTHSYYDDFSSPCFDGSHNSILNGSWVSTGNEASRFARYAFRKHFFQHLGFRMVKSSSGIPVRLIAPKEQVKKVMQQGGNDEEGLTNLAQISVTANTQYQYDEDIIISNIIMKEYGLQNTLEILALQKGFGWIEELSVPTSKALVLGSSSGRAAFEMSKNFENVLAIDYSNKLLAVAEEIKCSSMTTLPYSGDKNLVIDKAWKRENVIFKQLTWLSMELGCHDLVLVTFLHRLQNTQAWLHRLHELVKQPGILVIVSVDTNWTAAQLQPYLQHRLKLMAEEMCDFDTPEGCATGAVSIWCQHSDTDEMFQHH
ncbi:ergothioneine biosynthesis protein 1-like isoform X1 [Argonauta hians]